MPFPLSKAKAIPANVATPFTLSFTDNGVESTFKCQQILRQLPTKRLVCSGTWKNEAAVAKIFFNKRHFSKEVSALGKLAKSNLPSPHILHRQADEKNNTFLLITNYLPNKGDLKNLWDSADTNQRRSGLLKAAAVLIAKMHQTNCIQKDIHWGNFLISGSDAPTIIDAGQIVFKPLSAEERLNNLALFFAQMEPAYDHLISQSLTAYQELFPHHPISAQALEDAIKSQRAYRIKKYALKCLRNATQFSAQQQWNKFSVIDKSYPPAKHFNEAELNTLIASGNLLKGGNTATVAQANHEGQSLTVKRYNIKNTLHFLKRCFKPSRARRSWQNGHTLQLLGINTAKPLALLEKRIGPIQLKSYLVTEYLEGTLLTDYVKSLENENNTIPDWLNDQITQMLTGLWRAGISHGDFKATNFLVAGEKLYLIDLDSMRVHRKTSALQQSIGKDCKRFLKNWDGDTLARFQALLDHIKKSELSLPLL